MFWLSGRMVVVQCSFVIDTILKEKKSSVV